MDDWERGYRACRSAERHEDAQEWSRRLRACRSVYWANVPGEREALQGAVNRWFQERWKAQSPPPPPS